MILALVACAASPAPVATARSTTAGARPYWVGITVPDAEASARWYQDKLHFTVTKRMDLPAYKLRIVFLDLNGFTLELIEFQDLVSIEAVRQQIPALVDLDKLQGIRKIGFLVPDVDRLAAELERSGVTLRMKPTSGQPPELRFFLVDDNAGNVLQFFSDTPGPGHARAPAPR
jgi:catechol 2,3-dioxygenase-like lactoylglutathione lyase family enzyme